VAPNRNTANPPFTATQEIRRARTRDRRAELPTKTPHTARELHRIRRSHLPGRAAPTATAHARGMASGLAFHLAEADDGGFRTAAVGSGS